MHGRTITAPIHIAINCPYVSLLSSSCISLPMGLASALGIRIPKMATSAATTAAQNKTHMILHTQAQM